MNEIGHAVRRERDATRGWVPMLLAAVLVAGGCGDDSDEGSATTQGSETTSAGATTDGSTTSGEKIVVGATPIINAVPLYLGIEKGFFDEAGLDVEASLIQAAATAIPQLLNGELQYALVSTVPTITARSQGLGVQIALANDEYPRTAEEDITGIVVAPDSGIADLADLDGKTMAIAALKSIVELAPRMLLAQAGLDPDSVRFVELPYPDMIAAVNAGTVDAALLGEPFLSSAVEEGLSVIAWPFSAVLAGISGLTWIASEEYLTGNADAAQRFKEAMTRAIEYAAGHPDEVRAVAKTFMTTPPAAIDKLKLPNFSADITEQDIETVATAMLEHGFVEAEPDTSSLVHGMPLP